MLSFVTQSKVLLGAGTGAVQTWPVPNPSAGVVSARSYMLFIE